MFLILFYKVLILVHTDSVVMYIYSNKGNILFLKFCHIIWFWVSLRYKYSVSILFLKFADFTLRVHFLK